MHEVLMTLRHHQLRSSLYVPSCIALYATDNYVVKTPMLGKLSKDMHKFSIMT
jgi:hypothetical protein